MAGAGTPSIAKYMATLFSLDPKESGGRVRPQLSLHGNDLTTNRQTFLGV